MGVFRLKPGRAVRLYGYSPSMANQIKCAKSYKQKQPAKPAVFVYVIWDIPGFALGLY